MTQTFKILDANGILVNTILADPADIAMFTPLGGSFMLVPADPAEALVALATQARTTRNALLASSDWTQVADAPVDQAAWATYRQALRDITAQAGFPEQINWPVAPE